jgi:uncharacterized protein
MIAATSARGYVQAALENGFDVITLDAFADADTSAIAKQVFKLKTQDWQLDVEDFKRTFSSVDLTDVESFLYGSLFDNCPDALAWVAHRIRLAGNAPEVLKQAKDFSFFKLLDDLNIQHPEVRLEAPEAHEHWLCKQIGGNGGTHVRPASLWKKGDYFQKKIVGTPISMLFVADGKTAQLIGFNRQFVSPTQDLPYRFAGAVNNIGLQTNIHAAFEHAAQQLTNALSLRGINSLDAILCDDGQLWILELNPRLSATFHLYPDLFRAHIQGCNGVLARDLPKTQGAKAQWILYAEEDVELPLNFVWPSWVVDVPENNKKIAQHAPICTILAEAESADLAQTLVLQRAAQLKGKIFKND